MQALIKREITAHWKILFNGNGYTEDWVKEAEKRGLKNYRTTPEAIEHYLDKKNVDLFTRMQIYTPEEMHSHYDIKLEKYCQVLNIEVNTMVEMVNKDILPSCFKYMNSLADTNANMVSLGGSSVIQNLLGKLDKLALQLNAELEKLEEKHSKTKEIKDLLEAAKFYAFEVLPAMQKVRNAADQIEELLSEDCKPFPSYEDLLFSVQ